MEPLTRLPRGGGEGLSQNASRVLKKKAARKKRELGRARIEAGSIRGRENSLVTYEEERYDISGNWDKN